MNVVQLPLLTEKILNFSNTPYYSDVVGPDMGLIVVLNNTSDDYFYNYYNTVGFSVARNFLFSLNFQVENIDF